MAYRFDAGERRTALAARGLSATAREGADAPDTKHNEQFLLETLSASGGGARALQHHALGHQIRRGTSDPDRHDSRQEHSCESDTRARITNGLVRTPDDSEVSLDGSSWNSPV